VEERRILLDDSVSLLVDASSLVLAKVKWLLPQSTIIEDECVEEELPDESAEYDEALRLMEEFEFDVATGIVDGLIQKSEALYTRGYVTPIEETGYVETAAIEASELLEIMKSLRHQMKPREKTVVVLRRNFSEHMVWFWKEVTKLSSKYVVLRFSLFISSSRQDSVLNFLVLLELVKRRRVFARQPEVFGDIMFSTKRDVIARIQDGA